MSRTVLVTGSASGIGKGIVELFASRQWTVIGIDIQESRGIERFIKASASDWKALEETAAQLKKEGVQIDCIVNNAATQVEKRFQETSLEEWDHVLKTNLTSVFVTTRCFFPLLQKNASIINVSSVHARATSPGMAAYVASKGAVSALTRAMALELAPQGIRVNAVLPGATDTPMLKKGLGRNGSEDKALQGLLKATPLGRVGTPREVAHQVYFLADAESSGFITGQEFVCDGGVLARLASE